MSDTEIMSPGTGSISLDFRSDRNKKDLSRRIEVRQKVMVDDKPAAERIVSGDFNPRLGFRRLKAQAFAGLLISAVCLGVASLFVLLGEVVVEGGSRVSWEFLTGFPSRFAHRAGLYSALMGSVWVLGFTALFSIPIGVGAALYLEEYSRKGKLASFIEINISNLAGVPSIIYGLLGLVVFVRTFSLERSVLAGSLTLSLLILPVIIVASREALKAVPQSIRHAAYALGATRWQAIRAHVLPAALPGIMTGVILALSRALGETAPLIVVGAVAYIAFVPEGPFSAFTVLPMQIYDWTGRPQESFHEIAAAGILVLLVVLLSMNAVAIFLRNHFQKKYRW